MKIYNSKSNAVRAMNTYAQKVQEFLKGTEVVACEEGFKVVFQMHNEVTEDVLLMLEEKFEVMVDRRVEIFDEEPVVGEFTNCPHCGVHLSNGYDTADYMIEDNNAERAAFGRGMKLEFLCLGCSEEFGPANPYASTKGTGLKIQKDREEKNGVKRPSEGGKCATLWALFDTMHSEKGMVPTPKPAKDRSAVIGMDPTTTQVQLYRWREFMGFKGK
jgi:hypothetical protein